GAIHPPLAWPDPVGLGPARPSRARDRRVGSVGTVLSTEDARNAVKAGASFLMSPATIKVCKKTSLNSYCRWGYIRSVVDHDGVLFDLQGDEVLYIPGVMTPTEILDAYNSGARIVKIYPVLVLEGARYISVLRKPFSHIPMVASQGITIDMIRTYIGSGACAVVLSDAIFEKSAMAQRNYDEIYRLASLATWQGVQAVQQTGRKFC
ncbi:hypothetical protein Taro_028988, partial [Colocasia esculenta]|nr:hypothetical protein [Colocasia esculenta]